MNTLKKANKYLKKTIMTTILTFLAVLLINLIAYISSSGRKSPKKQKVHFKGNKIYHPNQRMYVSLQDMYNHRNAGAIR